MVDAVTVTRRITCHQQQSTLTSVALWLPSDCVKVMRANATGAFHVAPTQSPSGPRRRPQMPWPNTQLFAPYEHDTQPPYEPDSMAASGVSWVPAAS